MKDILMKIYKITQLNANNSPNPILASNLQFKDFSFV